MTTKVMHAPHNYDCKVQDMLPLCGADGIIDARHTNVSHDGKRITCVKCKMKVRAKYV